MWKLKTNYNIIHSYGVPKICAISIWLKDRCVILCPNNFIICEVDPPPNGYSLRISGQAGPITPNSRVELQCELQPPHPTVKVQWVNMQSLPMAPSGHLIIERFTDANEGNYVCEAFLPDGSILRQVCFLILSFVFLHHIIISLVPLQLTSCFITLIFKTSEPHKILLASKLFCKDFLFYHHKSAQFLGITLCHIELPKMLFLLFLRH